MLSWRDGTKAFVMTPASPLRDSVVPRSVKGRESNTGKRIGTKSSQCPAKRSSGQNYIPWAELLRKVFGEGAGLGS